MIQMPAMRVLSAPLFADTNIARELQIEEDARTQGIARYWRNARQAVDRGEGAMLQPVQRLFIAWLPNIIEKVRKEQREISDGMVKEGRGWYGMVVGPADARKISAAAVGELLNNLIEVPEGIHATNLAFRIGRAVVATVNAEIIKRHSQAWKRNERQRAQNEGNDYRPPVDDCDMWSKIVRNSKRVHPRHVNKVAKEDFSSPLVDYKVYTTTGLFFLWTCFDCMVVPDGDEIKPAIVIGKKWIKRKNGMKVAARWVNLHDSARKIIDEGHKSRQMLRPLYQPMVTHPYPWQAGPSGTLADGVQGGYIRIRTPLIGRMFQVQREQILAAKMPRLLEGLNRVSGMAWKINNRVLDVARQVWTEGGNMLSIPPRDQRDQPPIPEDIDTNKIANANYRRDMVAWHKQDVSDRALRTEFVTRLGVAEQFANDTFYFPHQLDFRSRAYPIPASLNHQGPDLCRGLLNAANGAEPGNRGTWWLMVHAANCYGVDRVPFDERVQWVMDHMGEIARVARDPLGTDFWHHADKGKKPWQFLAACFALTDPEAAAHLPVQWDGTCNGIQHYVAMTRDEQTAWLVNMAGDVPPANMYSEVQKQVLAKAMQDDEMRPHAHLITRDLVKPPVMTSTYGVTIIGMRTQIKAYLDGLNVDKDVGYLVSRKCSMIIAEVMKSMCPRVTEAMRWLKVTAREIAKSGTPVRFVSPLGFPVVLPYTTPSTSYITYLGGSYSLECYPSGRAVSAGKSSTGFPPHFVHTHDASHMFMTAMACPFDTAAAHDCFSAVAAHGDTINRVLREKFVEMYSGNVLRQLYEYVRTTLGVNVEPPPEQGVYNIATVLESPYFFH